MQTDDINIDVFDIRGRDFNRSGELSGLVESLGHKKVGGPVLEVRKLDAFVHETYEIKNPLTETVGVVRIVDNRFLDDNSSGVVQLWVPEEFRNIFENELISKKFNYNFGKYDASKSMLYEEFPAPIDLSRLTKLKRVNT